MVDGGAGAIGAIYYACRNDCNGDKPRAKIWQPEGRGLYWLCGPCWKVLRNFADDQSRRNFIFELHRLERRPADMTIRAA